MEEGPWELDSVSAIGLVEAMNFLAKACSCLSSLSSDPLFSSIVTLYILILLYLPRIFLGIVFSPVLISTGVLLLTLLRLGVNQQEDEGEPISDEPPIHLDLPEQELKCFHPQPDKCPETPSDFDTKPFFFDSFVEWNVRAPLEVIYEEFEGEEDDDPNATEETRFPGIERYPSLSLCFPESDSDTSSDGEFPGINGWNSPENLSFKWDQDDREELIEIALDGKLDAMFHVEEDNLIEIDISPARNHQFSGHKR